MPLKLSFSVAHWLNSKQLLKPEPSEGNNWEVSYNDQLYLENGFLIGQLLRVILKEKGHTSEGLMRIRKIAHISSN